MSRAKKSQRQGLITKIHIAKAYFKLDDDTYRAVLLEQIGKNSCAKASIKELETLVEHFIALGWKPAPAKKAKAKKLADGAQIKKIRALWLELRDLDALRDPSEEGLRRFAKRMTKVDSLQWLTPRQASVLIEELKGWVERIRNKQSEEKSKK